ncbi:MAG: hypoxanthine phosphoribosyltransferase [Verrucomicrobiae bacterium]|nr:hypoxanthine phosphoribosyltransferase [Verrucomicrobiae bacterium]
MSAPTTPGRLPETSRRLQPPPPRWRHDLAGVLIPEDRLARRVRQLAAAIQRDYRHREPVLVALLSGTVVFLADLVRHLELPLRLDFLSVSSYGASTTSGELTFTKDLRLDIQGRDVLVVEDILDTGRTLTAVLAKLRAHRPRRLRVCVLLDKPARRQVPVTAHYTGFRIPDFFVVGYGLDFAERYRNLPFIGVLKPEKYATPAPPA